MLSVVGGPRSDDVLTSVDRVAAGSVENSTSDSSRIHPLSPTSFKKKLIGCVVSDIVMAAVLLKGNDDMIPTKYLNVDKQQEITDAINAKLSDLNAQEVVKLVRVQ